MKNIYAITQYVESGDYRNFYSGISLYSTEDLATKKLLAWRDAIVSGKWNSCGSTILDSWHDRDENGSAWMRFTHRWLDGKMTKWYYCVEALPLRECDGE